MKAYQFILPRETWISVSKPCHVKPALELDAGQWFHGEPVRLSELIGKVVALHFWASRIVREVEAIRMLNTLQRVYREEGVAYPIAIDKASSVVGANREWPSTDKPSRGSASLLQINREGIMHSKMWDENLEGKIRALLSK